MMWRRKFTADELKFAYDCGRAHQLLEERIGVDDEITAFEQVMRELRGSVR
jgi:hypothetical protein